MITEYSVIVYTGKTHQHNVAVAFAIYIIHIVEIYNCPHIHLLHGVQISIPIQHN